MYENMDAATQIAKTLDESPPKKKKARRLTGGQWLRRWRRRKGYATCQDAADALGVTRHSYRRWEAGECSPGRDVALLLSKKTGCPITIWAGRR